MTDDQYTANLRATAQALRTQAEAHTAHAAQCIRMAEQYEAALTDEPSPSVT